MTKTVTVAPPILTTKPSKNTTINSRKHLLQSEESGESKQTTPSRATSIVDNPGGSVDNPLSIWEEALLEGGRRRAEETRRRAEREGSSWTERGPPET